MLYVVDKNALSTDELRKFFIADQRNTAVLTDYLAHDIFAAPDTRHIRESFKVVAEFPKQTVVLKSNAAIARLRWHKSGLTGRMIDEERTANLRDYCIAVNRRDASMTRDLLEKSDHAYEHVQSLLQAAGVVRNRLALKIATYPKREVDAIRRSAKISREFQSQFIADIIGDTKALYAEIGFLRGQLPPAKQVVYTMPFRFTVCVTALQLIWTKRGKLPQNPERVRNDITDMTYAAYATYFDGLMTNDQDLLLSFNLSVHILDKLFGIRARRSR
jgi:hypothetical protein